MGITFIAVGSSEMFPIGISMFILWALWAYLRLRVKYVVSRSAIKVLRGSRVVEEAPISDIRKARIKVKGGKARSVSDVAFWSIVLATSRGPGLPFILDTGNVEFIDPEGRTILKVKGVKVGKFLISLKDIITQTD